MLLFASVILLLGLSAQADYVIMSEAENFTAYKEGSNGSLTPVQGVIETIEVLSFQPVSVKSDPGIDIQVIVSPLNATSSIGFSQGTTGYQRKQPTFENYDNFVPFTSQSRSSESPSVPDALPNTISSTNHTEDLPSTSVSGAQNQRASSSSSQTSTILSDLFSGLKNTTASSSSNQSASTLTDLFPDAENQITPVDSNQSASTLPDLFSGAQSQAIQLNSDQTASTLSNSFSGENNSVIEDKSTVSSPEVGKPFSPVTVSTSFNNETDLNVSQDAENNAIESAANSTLTPFENPRDKYTYPHQFDTLLNSTNTTSQNASTTFPSTSTNKTSAQNLSNSFPLLTAPKSESLHELTANPFKSNPLQISANQFSPTSFGTAAQQQPSSLFWLREPTSTLKTPAASYPGKTTYSNSFNRPTASSYSNSMTSPWNPKPANNYLFGSKTPGKGPYADEDIHRPQFHQNLEDYDNQKVTDDDESNSTKPEADDSLLNKFFSLLGANKNDRSEYDDYVIEDRALNSTDNKTGQEELDMGFGDSDRMSPLMYFEDARWTPNDSIEKLRNTSQTPFKWNAWKPLNIPNWTTSNFIKLSNVSRTPTTNNVSFTSSQFGGGRWNSSTVDGAQMFSDTPNFGANPLLQNLSFPSMLPNDSWSTYFNTHPLNGSSVNVSTLLKDAIELAENSTNKAAIIVDYEIEISDEPEELNISPDELATNGKKTEKQTGPKEEFSDISGLMPNSDDYSALFLPTDMSDDYGESNATTGNAITLNRKCGMTGFWAVIACALFSFLGQRVLA